MYLDGFPSSIGLSQADHNPYLPRRTHERQSSFTARLTDKNHGLSLSRHDLVKATLIRAFVCVFRRLFIL